MTKRRLFNFILPGFLFLSSIAYAQSNTVATGGDATGTDGSVSYSIGQVNYLMLSGSDGTVTEGLQQPYEILTVTGVEKKGILLNAAVYPNPSSDYVLLTVEEVMASMRYSLTDQQGKLIAEQPVNSRQTTISLEELAAGSYFIKIFDNTTAIKIFKVIKNN